MRSRFRTVLLMSAVLVASVGIANAQIHPQRNSHEVHRQPAAGLAGKSVAHTSTRYEVTLAITDSMGQPGPHWGVFLFETANTGLVVDSTSVSGADGTFTFRLPAGIHNFYLREGLQLPQIYPDLDIRSDTTIALVYEPVPYLSRGDSPLREPVQSTRFVFSETGEEIDIIFSADAAIDSAFAINETMGFRVDGQALLRLPLDVSGPRPALRVSATGSPERWNWHRGGMLSRDRLLYAQTWSNGIASLRPLADDPTVFIVNSGVERALVLATGADWQATDHLLNLIVPGIQLEEDLGMEYARTALRMVETPPDVVVVLADLNLANIGGISFVMTNEVEGIGLQPLALSDEFADVRGRILMFGTTPGPPLIHEFMHQWAAHNITPLGSVEAFGHWGYSDVYGQLGGFEPGSVEYLDANTVRVKYLAPYGRLTDRGASLAPLEKYLMGVLPPQDLPETFQVLKNPVETDWDGTYTTLEVDSVVTLTREDLLNFLGPRVPAANAAPNTLDVLWVVVSEAPLDDAGLAFFNQITGVFSGRADPGFDQSFNDVTGGLVAIRDSVSLAHGTTLIDPGGLPTEFELGENYPNPFNPITTITYHVPQAGDIRLAVYDILGRRLSTIVDGWHSPGWYRHSFDASGHPSGLYLYRLEALGASITRTMLLIR